MRDESTRESLAVARLVRQEREMSEEPRVADPGFHEQGPTAKNSSCGAVTEREDGAIGPSGPGAPVNQARAPDSGKRPRSDTSRRSRNGRDDKREE